MNKLFFIIGVVLSLSVFGEDSPLLSIDINKGVIVSNSTSIIIQQKGSLSFVKDRYGIDCSALYLDGQSYLQIGNNELFEKIDKEFSFSCWFKIDNQDKPWLTFICKGDNPIETPYNPAFRVQVFQYSKNSTVSVNTAFTEYDKQFQKHPLVSERWMHFTLTAGRDFVKYYIDGQLVFEQKQALLFNKNSSDLFIGKDIPGATEFFTGYLDDIKLFSTALEDEEIRANYVNSSVELAELLPDCIKDVNAFTMPNLCGSVVSFTLPKSADPCENLTSTLLSDLNSGSIFPNGVSKIRYEIKKGVQRKECFFEVTVEDHQAPTIICPKDTTFFTGEKIVLEDPVVLDNCAAEPARLVFEEGNSQLMVGRNNLRYHVVDLSGNSNECSFVVNLLSDTTGNTLPKTTKLSKTTSVQKVKASSRPSVLLKNDLESDELNIHNIKARNKELVIFVFDDQTEDKDSVNIYVNGSLVRENAQILNFDKSELVIEPAFDRDYCLVEILALNQGEIGLNTVKIEVHYKKYIDQGEYKYPLLQKTFKVIQGGKTELIINTH